MTIQPALKLLISKLQKAISEGGMTEEIVDSAIKKLSEVKYKYDDGSYPALVDTGNFNDTSGNTPGNLAEALLWKLGKWKAYKKFAAYYQSDDSGPTKNNVVLCAFAKHLRNVSNPIYDQHAMRALWAICGMLTDNEKKKCKSLLFNKKQKWKKTGSGASTIECYKLFVRHLDDLVNIENGPAKGRIDRLLMPLGQAIKSSAGSYEEFCQLCGWRNDG